MFIRILCFEMKNAEMARKLLWCTIELDIHQMITLQKLYEYIAFAFSHSLFFSDTESHSFFHLSYFIFSRTCLNASTVPHDLDAFWLVLLY